MRALETTAARLEEAFAGYHHEPSYLEEVAAIATLGEVYATLEANQYEVPGQLSLDAFLEGVVHIAENDSDLSDFDKLVLLEALELCEEGFFDKLKTKKNKLAFAKHELVGALLRRLPKSIHYKLASHYADKASKALFYGDYDKHKHANRMQFFHMKHASPKSSVDAEGKPALSPIDREREIAKQYGHARPGSAESSRRAVYAAKKMHKRQSALANDVKSYRASIADTQVDPKLQPPSKKGSVLTRPLRALAARVRSAVDTARYGKEVEKHMREIPLPPLNATNVYPSRKSRRIVMPKSTYVTADTRADGSRRD